MDTIKIFKYSRRSTIILLNNTDEELWDTQPDGFPNTIRWNAGHVYVTAEDFLKDADENFPYKRSEWDQLFIDGTRPSEWGEDIPTKEEIIAALEEQEDRIAEHLENKLDDKATKTRDINGTLLDTVDSSLQFVTWHEGLHLGIAKSIRDAIQ